MDNGTQSALCLIRLPQGGYVVQDAYQPDRFNSQHFASASIDEALKFIRDKMFPIPPAAAPFKVQTEGNVAFKAHGF